MTTPSAYVYAVVVDGVVRYIGKGSGIPLKRAKEHERAARALLSRRRAGERPWARRFINKLAAAIEHGAEIRIDIVATGLDHDGAFALERETIAGYSAVDLWNSDSGGCGGKTVSEETRRRQSMAARLRIKRPGERERMIRISQAAATIESRAANAARGKQMADAPGAREGNYIHESLLTRARESTTFAP